MKERSIELLAQADLIQLMAALLGVPGDALRGRLAASDEEREELVAASGLADAGLLSRALSETLALAAAQDHDAWLAERSRLFECAVVCPINETGYVRRDKGAINADIAGFYQAFGLELSPTATETPDHLTCELQFVALLLVLWARAEAAGEEEHAGVTRDALRAFVADHLGEWLGGFCLRLAEHTELLLYVNVAGLITEVWSAFAAYHALPAPQRRLATVEVDGGSPYECDMASPGGGAAARGPIGREVAGHDSAGHGERRSM